jgi:hypothetical protein
MLYFTAHQMTRMKFIICTIDHKFAGFIALTSRSSYDLCSKNVRFLNEKQTKKFLLNFQRTVVP